SNSCASVLGPPAVWSVYSFSTATHGSDRRWRASSSPIRVCSFSCSSSAADAACHSARVPRVWVVMVVAMVLSPSSPDRLGCHQRRVLALELLRDARAPTDGQRLRHRVGEDLLLTA